MFASPAISLRQRGGPASPLPPNPISRTRRTVRSKQSLSLWRPVVRLNKQRLQPAKADEIYRGRCRNVTVESIDQVNLTFALARRRLMRKPDLICGNWWLLDCESSTTTIFVATFRVGSDGHCPKEVPVHRVTNASDGCKQIRSRLAHKMSFKVSRRCRLLN
jgi:hypothetical protein